MFLHRPVIYPHSLLSRIETLTNVWAFSKCVIHISCDWSSQLCSCVIYCLFMASEWFLYIDVAVEIERGNWFFFFAYQVVALSFSIEAVLKIFLDKFEHVQKIFLSIPTGRYGNIAYLEFLKLAPWVSLIYSNILYISFIEKWTVYTWLLSSLIFESYIIAKKESRNFRRHISCEFLRSIIKICNCDLKNPLIIKLCS